MNRILLSSARHDWRTPIWLLDRVRQSHILTLDACATDASVAVCESFISPEQDALKTDWVTLAGPQGPFINTAIWCNPPYGRALPDWADKIIETSYQATVITLVPARTDTRWFRYLANHGRTGFLPGRLRFRLPNGTETHPATFPSALIWVSPTYKPAMEMLNWKAPKRIKA